ncbi:MAG TPA: hypothetical protein VEC38_13510 [Candidatus Binataceae bacterium]|nr:hypothetical protein [Candidatus Binataceae bacterium]
MNRKPGVIILAAVALAMTAMWLGCGVKSPPIPPELARPERIDDLRADSAQGGVRLVWSRPERYASGRRMRDLGSFVLMRSKAEAKPEKLAEIPVTDQQRFRVQHEFSYLDQATTLGEAYSYRVMSRTLDGYVSEPSNEASLVRAVPKPPPNPEEFVIPTPAPLP